MKHIDTVRHMGIDPGHNAGGLCVIDGKSAIVVCASWKKMTRKSGNVWKVQIELADDTTTTTEHVSVYHALDHIWGSITWIGPYYLAVEQPFIPHRSMKGLVKLIESAGAVVSIWAPAALGLLRAPPNRWRSQVLHLAARTKAKDAEARAVEWSMEEHPRVKLLKIGHVSEAYCIAKFLLFALGSGPVSDPESYHLET